MGKRIETPMGRNSQVDPEKEGRMSSYQNPLSPEDKTRLDALLSQMEGEAETAVGYPCNTLFDYSELWPFLQFSVNNIGDPFEKSNYRVNSREIEQEVIKFFAELTGLPPDDYWGYVTNGGSEGNLYGVFLARETMPNAMVYYSEDTHYSVGKAMRVLGVNSIMIRRQDNGEFDYDDLKESIKVHRDIPAIVFTTVGTTMTGALDTTLLGSRNGITPLFLWYAIKRHGIAGFTTMIQGCLAVAEYAVETFNKNGIEAWRNEHGNTVIFPKPSQAVLDKWQIAVHGKIAHVITMPQITKSTIDQIVKDMLGNPVA